MSYRFLRKELSIVSIAFLTFVACTPMKTFHSMHIVQRGQRGLSLIPFRVLNFLQVALRHLRSTLSTVFTCLPVTHRGISGKHPLQGNTVLKTSAPLKYLHCRYCQPLNIRSRSSSVCLSASKATLIRLFLWKKWITISK